LIKYLQIGLGREKFRSVLKNTLLVRYMEVPPKERKFFNTLLYGGLYCR